MTGTIEFYEDNSRSTPKDVYRISGTPPNYVYTNIGSTIDVVNGQLVDDSNSIILPYLFPYDGDPDDTTNTLELYYAVVKNGSGITQFTREALPNLSTQTTESEESVNLVPNGQFLLHNNIPATQTDDAGKISAAVTEIAPGGWQFRRPDASTATDFVTFERFDTPVTNP